MTDSTLLLELLTEELPPKALARLGQAFANGILSELQSQGLCENTATVTPFATPRRLAVSISHIKQQADTKQVREKVLPVSIALDSHGQATPVLIKKLAALNCADFPLDKMERVHDGKAENLFLTRAIAGVTLTQGLQKALDSTIAKLPIPKVMNYQLHPGTAQEQDVQFVRPVHSVLALHGKDIVPVTAFGLAASNTTLGHRFLSTGTLTITQADNYASILREQGKVIANYEERLSIIRAALLKAAQNTSQEKKDNDSNQVLMPTELLEEVTALVEWPAIYTCHFDQSFLEVPQECLILTMQTNQKYFAITDASGTLKSCFLIVSNIETTTPQAIIEGNERVVRPRLADAKFFFEQDKKISLLSRLPQLANVVYHNKLGNQLERSTRLATIASFLASKMNVATDQAQRAAQIIKLDLLTHMVGEFPELQGTMGYYYARHDGEAKEIALACKEHYQPRFAGDSLPTTPIGTLLALTDKLETLVGIWGIGLIPTGEKDPYALRRHALGIMRLLVENKLSLDLAELLQQTYLSFPPTLQLTLASEDLLSFLLDRFRAYLRERTYTPQEIDAVLSKQPTQFHDIINKLDAVHTFAELPEAQALSMANKRIANVLKKNADADAHLAKLDPSLLTEAAEIALHQQLEKLRPEVEQAFAQQKFESSLCLLAGLRKTVDDFFDEVMVMCEDLALRKNRITLLAQLHQLMNRFADLSKLVI